MIIKQLQQLSADTAVAGVGAEAHAAATASTDSCVQALAEATDTAEATDQQQLDKKLECMTHSVNAMLKGRVAAGFDTLLGPCITLHCTALYCTDVCVAA